MNFTVKYFQNMRVFLKYAHICSYALYARSKIDFFNFLIIYINTCNDFKYYFTLQKICLYARIPNSNYEDVYEVLQ